MNGFRAGFEVGDTIGKLINYLLSVKAVRF